MLGMNGVIRVFYLLLVTAFVATCGAPQSSSRDWMYGRWRTIEGTTVELDIDDSSIEIFVPGRNGGPDVLITDRYRVLGVSDGCVRTQRLGAQRRARTSSSAESVEPAPDDRLTFCQRGDGQMMVRHIPVVGEPSEVLYAQLASAQQDGSQADSENSFVGGATFRDCEDACPEMVVIPGGNFTRGSPASEPGRSDDEGPQRRIDIGSFAASKFEVTFDQWAACVDDGGCTSNGTPSDEGWGMGDRPVINVSWDDAQEYVSWLSRRTGHTYRLLSEAEWEYAARAGTTTAFSTGPTISTTAANFNQTIGRTQPVGSYTANAFGLSDMHGNVWEWVQDCYLRPYPPYRNVEMDDCPNRVFRGGAWFSEPNSLRSAVRNADRPSRRDDLIGFRVARADID